MKLRFFSLMVATSMLLAAPAYALDLDEARASGAVGETLEGYVAVIQESAEAEALAAEVNAKRKVEYKRISAENQQTVEVVAKLAAQKIINKLQPGEKYQDAKGAWKTR